ncbi:hypothetical protein [Spirosoma utsteinense]|uniref:Glyoxylase-like metal-dependent hydrolase (Beta-lactamase superfamily II) n=1 Tax=Spirosoma utsteinense TaxID=2585773 RepID=A0ABR6W9M8_9BACT|nr:hypothetical protein [Spirosoma utsteinense]MBC3787677.1 glyoxylase-like metal-dependent hydrolase (beta-lactamase superfamily II) [Spirosoma utsteinense]MBC3793274.1 glyoxylase-like metal-dependent hydrolase (beta-lactamase superfamily II) [Spirosoma utsteinense]
MYPLLWLFLPWLTLPAPSTGPLSQQPLQACWTRQVKPIQNRYLRFSYNEQRYELEHSAEPWQQTPYEAKGVFWVNAANFRQTDTLYHLIRKKTYLDKTQASPQALLLLKPGEDKVAPVTRAMLEEQPIQTARYSPVSLIDYCYRQRIALDRKQSTADQACYTTTINQTIVSLFIRRADGLLTHLTTLQADELLGDVRSTITYHDYIPLGSSLQPTRTTIDKVNGKLHDQVQLSLGTLTAEAPHLIDTPANFQLQTADTPEPTAQVEKYNNHVYFINLPHTDDKVMMVEFANFLLVAEAPLTSRNGELIIREARRIAPTKPIRYFVFGHHHPHYLGGIRPFVHKGATILCSPGNEAYVKYLIEAPHQLQPDSLALDPKALKLEGVGTHRTITDGLLTLEIYLIGRQSAHTNDYLIYYFPGEQLLFEDDSVWIARTGAPAKASARQVGLYEAIEQLGLPVRTIIQSWPVSDYGVKTVIPFADLKASMPVK